MGLRGDRRGRTKRARIRRSRGTRHPLNAMAGKVRRVHVHLDLDVLDPDAVNPANEFAPQRGLRAEEVEACIWAIRERFEVTSATVASYDPSFDREGRVLKAGVTLTEGLAN